MVLLVQRKRNGTESQVFWGLVPEQIAVCIRPCHYMVIFIPFVVEDRRVKRSVNADYFSSSATQQLCGFGKSTSLSLLFVKCILLEVCHEAQINLRKYVTTCYICRGMATAAITITIFPRVG